MTAAGSKAADAERLEDLVAQALGQSRVARASLFEEVQPLLPDHQRPFARAMGVGMDGGAMFERRFLFDLDALLAGAQQVIDAGTERRFVTPDVPDNCMSSCEGYYETRRTRDAADLVEALVPVRDLRTLIQRVFDHLEAERAVSALRGTR